MSVKSAAARHREEIGEVRAVYRDRPSLLFALILGGVWLLFTVITLINPGETLVLAIAPSVIFAVIFGLIYLYMGSEALIIAERGVLIGSVAPGLRPYVIRYEQIAPGSVVPVTGARHYSHAIGTGVVPQSTVRRNFWTSQGVHFVGPSPREARRHKPLVAPFLDAPVNPTNGRSIWFAGTGSSSPREAVRHIAEAASRAGLNELAERTQQAGLVALDADPKNGGGRLPGVA